MKIVVAMDSFRGTMRSPEACEIVAAAIASAAPGLDIQTRPMADGGEGTAEALIRARAGRWLERRVIGPLPDMEVEAGFAWFDTDRMAVVEMASASGLELLDARRRNPLATTTYGTGQLVKAAADHGAKRILLALGGSATVDGGVGAAMALGWRFLDDQARPVGLGGGQLGQIARIVAPEQLTLPVVEVLCDVDNPLCGEQGAARVYGPQKGADAQMVERLESGLLHLAGLLQDQLGLDLIDVPGAGAAGGLGAGAMAFMRGRIVSGIETLISYTGLAHELTSADWVVTGEGCFDEQSLRGKVVSGVLALAKQTGTRAAVIAGDVRLGQEQRRRCGASAVLACRRDGMSLDDAMQHCRELLAKAAERFVVRHILR